MILLVATQEDHHREDSSRVNDTALLLGLDGVAVTKVVAADDGPVVHPGTADERVRVCPQCGVAAVRMKEWVTTRPRDLPVAGRRCALRWRKRRWCCDQESCPRQTFTEQVPQIVRRASPKAQGKTPPESPGAPGLSRLRGTSPAGAHRGHHRAGQQ
ncbi:transposase family protein [Nonomuraea sp. KM90]|uniref:transposase family protein n=1 Tax=Nonomuraea sp. KM90 TaxID=3457428 RepID=UPI003FCE4165